MERKGEGSGTGVERYFCGYRGTSKGTADRQTPVTELYPQAAKNAWGLIKERRGALGKDKKKKAFSGSIGEGKQRKGKRLP